MRIFRFAGILVIGAAALVAIGSASANAATPAVVPAGIGIGATITPNVTQVDMKPIPGTDANDTGLARPGDNIAVICSLYDNHGESWDFSLDRTGHAGQYGNTTGWIPDQYVHLSSSPFLCTAAVWNHLTGISQGYVQVDMKPIPGTDANDTGLAHAGDTLQVYCSLYDNRGLLWQLVLDRNGHTGQYAETVGFVPWAYTSDGSPAPGC